MCRRLPVRFYSTLKLSRSLDPSKLSDISGFTPDKIRNFGIVAHVDHGKSTLADRFLQMTNVIPEGERAQFLDKLQVEQERGITVKAQTSSMIYKDHLLNLIDTPGHADFNFEVSRSLAACDGILLLVAANQGVQAQTMANFWLAFEQDIVIVPVINKVDMAGVNVDNVATQLVDLFGFDRADIQRISAKTGMNVPSLLDLVLARVPPPKASPAAPFRGLIFDSWYDHFRGAIPLVLVKEGSITRGQKIRSFNNDKEYEVAEVGVMHPDMVPCQALYAGQVGYVVCNMRTVKEAMIGETLFEPDQKEVVVPFPGFKVVKPTVYAGLYPMDAAEYDDLKQALERLSLNDASVSISPDSSPALGMGWRIGFLGTLHMEVFGQRLDQEYDANVILTSPSVQYRARIKDNESIRKKRYNGQAEVVISDPAKFPDPPSDVDAFLEPVIMLTVIAPNGKYLRVITKRNLSCLEYLSVINSLCTESRGNRGDVSSVDGERMIIKWRMPLAEVVADFFERLKRLTSGYASFDYEHDGHQETDLVKLCISINSKPVDEFSLICPSSMVRDKAKRIVNKLKEEIPQQQYEVVIKATLGTSTKALVHGVIKPMKKDFSGLLKGNFGGGGMQRLQKKLSHQKKGKEKMKSVGQVKIPKEAFVNVLRS